MADDIQALLAEWPLDEEREITARQIRGLDGRELIQVRIEMGILQMETTGRPDGQRPHGFESLYHYHLQQARLRVADSAAYRLSREECAELHRESMQYYHRRVACMELGKYDSAVEDANHNLAVMDFLRDHHTAVEDWLVSEQFRAFVMMHRGQAAALLAVTSGQIDAAVMITDDAIRCVENIGKNPPQEEIPEPEIELRTLLRFRKQLVAEYGPSEYDRLSHELSRAVAVENYERAADLRDQLKLRKNETQWERFLSPGS